MPSCCNFGSIPYVIYDFPRVHSGNYSSLNHNSNLWNKINLYIHNNKRMVVFVITLLCITCK